MTSRGERIVGVAALLFLLAVTAAWWALALWPAPDETPAWLLRARAVCFDAGQSGLPGPSGWLLLVGQPLGMLAVLQAVWGRGLAAGLRALAGARAGRLAIAAGAAGIALGLGAAGVRVISASELATAAAPGEELPPDTYPRLDRPAPALRLVDQRGERLELGALAGRPVLVTFAFGHCETVCPAIVRQVLEARARLQASAAAGQLSPDRVPRVVVVTLDPWRDTPARLPHLAAHWEIPEEGFLLSGGVDEVNRVLDAWNVARQRDPRSGSVTHPPLVYVLDAQGRIAYAASGGAATLAELLGRS